MTTYYNFWSEESLGGRAPVTTPGETEVMIRRGFCDTTKQELANGVIANVIPVYAGEVVLDVWYRVITAEGTSNAKIDVGFNGSAVVASDGAVTPANTFVHNVTFVAIAFAANNAITIMPNNAVTIDAGVFEVAAVIVKSLDKA